MSDSRLGRRAFLLALIGTIGGATVLVVRRTRLRRYVPRGRRRRAAAAAALAILLGGVFWAADRIRLEPATARRLRRATAALLLLAAGGAAAGWIGWNTRDRTPGYTLHLRLRPTGTSPGLRVGFGRAVITPTLASPVWLAGFGKGRQATAVHDGLWAVAAVVDDGEHRLGVVALDAIGLFHEDVVAVRRLAARTKLDYIAVTSTHNHSAPDLLGIWGPRTWQTGVDPAYRAQVVSAAASALEDAASTLTPARLSVREVPLAPDGLIADTRDPQVFDASLRIMHFTRFDNGATLGTLINWANHPETPWAGNTEITADFPGYLRDMLEAGVEVDGRRVARGLGGTHVYVNGAIGGLMTTTPQTAVSDPYDGRVYATPSHDKARAVARRIGRAVLEHLSSEPGAQTDGPPPGAVNSSDHAARLTIFAETIELRLDNWLFRIAATLGVIDRGQPRWNRVRSEVAVIGLGDATIVCVPGELYPEIANGGIVHPPGADFDTPPVEVPPLRELITGRVPFLFGLANDEVGYIIPKSEWDDRAPWLFDAPERHYGEINSLGAETGPDVYAALRRLLDEAR